MFEALTSVTQDIYKFAHACKFTPHEQQRWVFDALMRGEEFIGVKSGQGPGKTACSALIAIWRTLRHPYTKTIYTAPSMRQVKDVAFSEVRKHVNNMPPWLQKFFKVDAMKLTVAGFRDWSIQGVTATKSENAQGYHEDGMTVIVEEASGVPRDIIDNFINTLTNPDKLMMMIGNPNSRDCAFYDIFDGPLAKRFNTFTFNTEETVTLNEGKFNQEWIDGMKSRNAALLEDFGYDSDIYRIRVRGEFPLTDPNTIIPAHLLEEAMEQRKWSHALRQINPLQSMPSRQIGIDLARFGGDESVVARTSGNAVVDLWAKERVEPIEAVRQAYAMQREAGWSDSVTNYVMDASGIGQGVLHNLYEDNKNVTEFHNGARAWDSRSYDNKITEAWFQLAQKLKNGSAYLPRDKKLVSQLVNRQYYVTKKGKLIIESKKEFEARGHDSPDRAEAVIYSLYDNVNVSGNVASKD